MRKFAISDIHGCVKTFKALLQKVEWSAVDELYLLGDYIDRGPDSKGVIDYILDLQARGFQVKCLRGNHEEQMLASIKHSSVEKVWLASNGGKQTLKSFELACVQDLSPNYLAFFNELAYYFEVDNYILVHAGLNFKHENPLKDHQQLLWIRDWYKDIDFDWLQNRIVVHGHTPVPVESIQEWSKQLSLWQVLDIDAGCVYQDESYNHLCAFELTSKQLFFQKNIDFG